MSIDIRQVGHEWLVEVKGKAIGTAKTELEARQLADCWTAKLRWVATWRLGQSHKCAVEAQEQSAKVGTD